MNYIMIALGIVLFMALVCVFFVLCPVIFNFAIIAVDEFLKMCRWMREKMKYRDYNAEMDIIIPKDEYNMLIDVYNEYYKDEIAKTEEGHIVTKDEVLNNSTPMDVCVENDSDALQMAYGTSTMTDTDMTQTFNYDPKEWDVILDETNYNPNPLEQEIPIY